MNKTTVALLSVLAAIVGIVIIVIASYVSAYNTGNRLEQSIKATYENNQNILAQYGNKIAEASQVPEMQRDDVKDVITAALDSRYGEEGSQAMFQFIQEQNPQIDSSVYTQIQQIIESGRKDFEVAQSKLIDQKRVYETQLGSLWTGMWMGIAGYPKIDLDEYSIVVNQRTLDAFESGVEEPIQLR
jgi:hypothetical protein